MPALHSSTTFLLGVALVCVCLAGFAMFQSKAASRVERAIPLDMTSSIRPAAEPKRRPLQPAAGWGDVLPQNQMTGDAAK